MHTFVFVKGAYIVSIFDNNELNKLRLAKEQRDNEGNQRKKAACAYIVECLQDFPAAAKKMGLRVYTTVDAEDNTAFSGWKISEEKFKAQGGICTNAFYVSVDGNGGFLQSINAPRYRNRVYAQGLEHIADCLYRYDNFYSGSKESVKKKFLSILAGKYN